MKKKQLQKILNDLSFVKIAVVGDFCLDAHWFTDESKCELSIETGHMTRPVRQQKYSLGGAGNVTNNLAAIGIKEMRAFGVVGSDPFGADMVNLMKKVNRLWIIPPTTCVIARLSKEWEGKCIT